MDNKKIYIAIAVVIGLFVSYTINKGDDASVEVEASVKSGLFEVVVATAGELKAKSSIKVSGPAGGMRRLSIWNVKISDLVPEGTKVDSGDHVASLDRSDILGKLKEVDLEITKMESQFLQTKLDTTLDLRSARNELVNIKFSLEESKIKLEQSKYEPPATIRKVEIELEQSKRKFDQERSNLVVKQEQAVAKMQEVEANLGQQLNQKELMLEVLDKFEIRAPGSGIVMYRKNYDGTRITTGSTIGPWSPEVAELPDKSVMISQTYVNEVDIRKIQLDQEVRITVDAFPDKKLVGKVINVANVGEQLPNSEAKVFQVKIELITNDTTLLPGMSTGNDIISSVKEQAMFIPLEAIHSNDSVSYVFLKTGFSYAKQQVLTGQSNDNEIEITGGLEMDAVILLSIPLNHAALEIHYLED